MQCYYPKPGYRIIYKGRAKIKEPISRPCGSCRGCRLEKAKEWAIRCMHEAHMYEDNSFITLTYNNENLPKHHRNEKGWKIPAGCIRKDHLQKFLRKLRKHYGYRKFRYYACGEYGERLGRPHYHICLFGLDFKDKKLIRQGKVREYKNKFHKSVASNSLYTSKTLEKIWNKGFVTIGEVTFESAGYVARYIMKKQNGLKGRHHYLGKTPEFALMSRMPGIGKPFFEKYPTDIYPKDFITMRGAKMKPPRYYDKLLEKTNPKLYKEVKTKRIQNINIEKPKDRLRRKKHTKLVTKTLIRSIENEQN